ncbi:MAG: protein-L-isoaspartate(D-aspartate) O-methyltransferase [Phycisphaerae bacterium]|nr:protein-L-isoaspartate(D-aspartate) O-methyltransferase [Phycisphaerae bacterium]
MDTCEGNFASLRCAMVERQLRARGISDRRVLEVMGEMPRERFLTRTHQHEAYADRPVPIGFGQTISQPYIVALMSQELDVRPKHRVLDVGAGSGYQTAILSRLGREVFAIERITELSDMAGLVLTGLGIDNVTLTTGDGTLGWAEHAPFDRIICGAAGPDVPEAWIEQLADGGRIVMPVGGPEVQNLVAVEKHGDKITRRDICGVRFVKLIGRQGWDQKREC